MALERVKKKRKGKEIGIRAQRRRKKVQRRERYGRKDRERRILNKQNAKASSGDRQNSSHRR